ncbi:MAG: Allophanate hydrolase subunit 1 [Marmoricola sp.]|jgi:KipI family sensor histidine kinase inhibitor|nr:Allophanate hydrolase subunit 1 [Marmoricola sp.]
MQVRMVGASAVLVEYDDPADVLAAYAEGRRRGVSLEIVPAATTVLFDGVADPHTLAAEIRTWTLSPVAPDAGDLVELPTTYDGPDLDSVARHWDLTTREVVALHRGTEFVVAFCGFAPGFAYCRGLPGHLAVPRLADPRARVPAGSVALAGPFTGIYPTASPGGWQLIGRTDAVLWRPDLGQPALLVPGTRVRFVDA